MEQKWHANHHEAARVYVAKSNVRDSAGELLSGLILTGKAMARNPNVAGVGFPAKHATGLRDH